MAKLGGGKASQRAAQNNKGGKGGGGGGGDAEKNLKRILELARQKEIEKRQSSGNQDDNNSEDDDSSSSYFERIPGIISTVCKLIFRVPWLDIISGQIMNVTTALEEAIDIIKCAFSKFNTEGWSPFQSLLKSIGMKVVDYIANFFERHVPNLHRDGEHDPYDNDQHKYDNEDFHNNKHGHFSDDDNDDFWRGLRKSDYNHDQNNNDEYAPYNPYHSNTRSDGERHYDNEAPTASSGGRRKKAFPTIAGIGRSSIFSRD